MKLFLGMSLIFFAEVGYIKPWGKDAALVNMPQKVHTQTYQLSPMSLFAEKMILLHQTYITHISGPRSHFRPTSSQYMLEAIRTYGFLKGYIMGCDRLLRENRDPWIYRTIDIKDVLYKWDPPKRASDASG